MMKTKVILFSFVLLSAFFSCTFEKDRKLFFESVKGNAYRFEEHYDKENCSLNADYSTTYAHDSVVPQLQELYFLNEREFISSSRFYVPSSWNEPEIISRGTYLISGGELRLSYGSVHAEITQLDHIATDSIDTTDYSLVRIRKTTFGPRVLLISECHGAPLFITDGEKLMVNASRELIYGLADPLCSFDGRMNYFRKKGILPGAK